MKNKKLHLHVLTLAVMLAASSAAMATVIPITLTNTTGNIWTANIGNTPALVNNTLTPFSDTFTFLPVATPGSTAYTMLNNITYSFTGLGNIMFSNANLNGNSLSITNTTFPGGSSTMALLTPTLISGPLTLSVNGTSTGGSYSGNFVVALEPVPEPETYAMMFSGLGILAMLARRRQQ
ncbi:hypothetical protein FHW58_003173 [Duganella sp. 1224]|uniref:FxDxF family PEP-CTERM protein n=1 Tax=Duganella sp. 1224 TaxID=2587052 RepID=UPI0015CB1D93|nr:FxDxF family PEP-CTERM protein [Duganella sp. 1224]NYE61966.1 hypothetical protein [Duganella sp. 1224]